MVTKDVENKNKNEPDDTDQDSSENIVVLPLNEDSKKITQTLSNEKSLKILDLLSEEPMSATDISKKLGLSITTIKYNIDSLLEADLIKVHRIKWSAKGREVKLYEPVQKLIIVAPGNMNVSRASIISMLQQYIGVIGAAFLGAAGIQYLSRPVPIENGGTFEPVMMDVAMESEVLRDAPMDMAPSLASDEAVGEVAKVVPEAAGPQIVDSIQTFFSNLSDNIGLWFFLGCLFAVILMMLKGCYYDNASSSTKRSVKRYILPLMLVGVVVAALSVGMAPTEDDQFIYPEIEKIPADHVFTEEDNGSTVSVNAGSIVRIDLDAPSEGYWYLSGRDDLFLNEKGYGYSSSYSPVDDDSVYGWTFETPSIGEKSIMLEYNSWNDQTSVPSDFEMTLIVEGDNELYPSFVVDGYYYDDAIELEQGEWMLIRLFESTADTYAWNMTLTDGLQLKRDQFIPQSKGSLYGKHEWKIEAIAAGEQNISAINMKQKVDITGYEQIFDLTVKVL
ncbi:protease inhibitor I42 family protein [Methanococcoides burtonii]|uniref:Transcriptional regulator, ArsR family n=1 Tax=Methanococcoides burtonii (strain DSM 6242 / NBRC 107633 / OCM 468 / ACE-M) TaxID=259564 RepID=Q12WV3_METBU|nr:protease inhibitor I42 family protein [Methanococcoides burtonii]ABE52073.1 Transcriptional regulator, ArsR family [Methanococcoides burtonii DSM 6242]